MAREHLPARRSRRRALAQRLDEQALVRRAPAAASCLGLIQVMRGVSRLEHGAALRPALKQIAKHLRVAVGRRAVKEAQPPPEGPSWSWWASLAVAGELV